MPYYSTRSATRLAECHADLQALFNEVIKHRDCSILCGARSKEDQDTAVAEGRSKAAWPTSNHNVDGAKRVTSWAVDAGDRRRHARRWSNDPRDSLGRRLGSGRGLEGRAVP